MKKIIFSLLACVGLLSSCSMDTEQPGVLDDQTALDNPTNVRYFRNFLYSSFRGMTSGGWVYETELQMDQFFGLSSNGGRGMNANGGDINSTYSPASSTWASCYSVISRCNYMLEEAQKLVDGGTLTDDKVAEVNRYIGEAHFFRAYAYFFLMDHFCQTYTAEIGDTEALGVPLVTVYDPTGDTSKYPGRSTLNQTLKFIHDDLNACYDALKAYEDAGNLENTVAGAPYLSTYVVEALRARIALVTGDYDTAIEKAQAVIANTNYQLAEDEDYMDMWADKNVDELIFAPFVDVNESGTISSMCEGWNYWWASATQSDYLPTEALLFASVEETDIRFDAFFEIHECTVQGGTAQAYAFIKWPGDPSLSTGTDMYLNAPKPFRLSEQYLILAEAAASKKDMTLGTQAYNDLRKARVYEDFAEIQFTSPDDLLAAVRDQRSLELCGEGFRMSDLRRWKVAWNRNVTYDNINPDITPNIAIQSRNVAYSADDYRYVWPIPAAEIEINPQIADQQNPGY